MFPRQDSTVSNSLLLRCLSSRLSCACSRFRSCFQKFRDLLWHRYWLPIVENNDRVVHSCPFRSPRKGTHPRCRYSAKY